MSAGLESAAAAVADELRRRQAEIAAALEVLGRAFPAPRPDGGAGAAAAPSDARSAGTGPAADRPAAGRPDPTRPTAAEVARFALAHVRGSRLPPSTADVIAAYAAAHGVPEDVAGSQRFRNQWHTVLGRLRDDGRLAGEKRGGLLRWRPGPAADGETG